MPAPQPAPTRIVFRQSGGLLGAARECDTATLDAGTARKAAELLQAAGVRGPIERLSRGARDATRYEITLTEGDKTTRIVVDDASLTPELWPLVEYLSAQSRPAALKQTRGKR